MHVATVSYSVTVGKVKVLLLKIMIVFLAIAIAVGGSILYIVYRRLQGVSLLGVKTFGLWANP